MAQFFVAESAIELPAVQLTPGAHASDASDWERGAYITVKFLENFDAFRVHTDGRSYPNRPAASSFGKWVAIGDVVLTRSQLAEGLSLPKGNDKNAVSFTHVNKATILATCVCNIGIASPKFGRRGGSWQAEYVSGPLFKFDPLVGAFWCDYAGHA